MAALGFASYGKHAEVTSGGLGELRLAQRGLPHSPIRAALPASASRTPRKPIRQPPGERGQPHFRIVVLGPRFLTMPARLSLWGRCRLTDAERLLDEVRELVRRDLHQVRQRLGALDIGDAFWPKLDSLSNSALEPSLNSGVVDSQIDYLETQVSGPSWWWLDWPCSLIRNVCIRLWTINLLAL